MKSIPEITRDNDEAERVTALRLVKLHGKSLIGKQVWTPPMGDYPGGIAVVTEIQPDPTAPDIVFQVEHPTVGSMGVFYNERVRLQQ